MDEVTYADYSGADLFNKLGYLKIDHACKQAEHDGFDYVWVDTCCIDKSSSAELTEAINSMFVWYRKAQIRYTYLEDVLVGFRASRARASNVIANEISGFHGFGKSGWFTRGWTLQELLAPENVEFYSGEWMSIGSKTTLVEQISQITKIGTDLLLCKRPLYSASIAQRMSWAADRETTRKEDLAYCLLGIFDVNIPLLYGEGEKAFIRLQEGILRSSDDQSLFAWTELEPQRGRWGLLAKQPSMFKHSGDITSYRDWSMDPVPTTVTNLALGLSLTIDTGSPDTCYARFRCKRGSEYVHIVLLRVAPAGRQFYRSDSILVTFPALEHLQASDPILPEPCDVHARTELMECTSVLVINSRGNLSRYLEIGGGSVTSYSIGPGSGPALSQQPHATDNRLFSKYSDFVQEIHVLKVEVNTYSRLIVVFELNDSVRDITDDYQIVAAPAEHLTALSARDSEPQMQTRWTMATWKKALDRPGAWRAEIGDVRYNRRTARQTFHIRLFPPVYDNIKTSQPSVESGTSIDEKSGWSFLAPLQSKLRKGRNSLAESVQK